MATETTPTATPALHPCECQQWEIGEDIETDGEPDVTIEGTDCTETTAKLFAPGHDAKLKALLIRAHREGLEIRSGRPTGVVTHHLNAVEASKQFGFSHQVARAVQKINADTERKMKRAAEKEATAAAKPPRQVAVRIPADQVAQALGEVLEVATGDAAAQAGKATIKVGRWEYDAVIDADGTATYTDRDGATQTRERDGYRVLLAHDEAVTAERAEFGF